MKRDTTKRSGAKTVISKEWKPTDGINALPAVIRARVLEAVTKFRRGEPPEDNFFSKRFNTETKMAIASELVMEHVPMGDIARLLGMTRRAIDYMMARIRERNANLLPVTWNRDRLISTVDALEDAGYMSMSLAEGEPDPKNKARFLSIATKAYSDAGSLRLKLGVSKEVLELLRKRATQDLEEQAPDPKDRIDYIDWVYQNKIAPKLEAQDAEIVPNVEEQNLRVGTGLLDDNNGGGPEPSGKDDSSTK